MRKPSRTLAIAASVMLVGSLAACASSGDGDGAGSPTPTTMESQTVADSLTTGESRLGTILVDGKGMTIYLFTQDTQGSSASTCEGGCLAAWPAVGELTAGSDVDAALLGTITRTDGTMQATYNGWPLYYYVQDGAAGDTTGQGVDDVWWVMDPDGNAIQ